MHVIVYLSGDIILKIGKVRGYSMLFKYFFSIIIDCYLFFVVLYSMKSDK